MNGIVWLTRIYFGIPRSLSGSFRPAKPITKIVVFGVCGLPLLVLMSVSVYADIYHSVFPLQMLIAGAVQFAIETDSSCSNSVPPGLAAAIRRLTPEQLDQSEIVFRGSMVVAGIYIVFLLLLLSRTLAFIVRWLRRNYDQTRCT